MSVRVLEVNSNIEKSIPTFILDTTENIIRRIAVSFDTTKKYLYFVDDIPDNFVDNTLYRVENLLEIIKANDNFNSLYNQIKDKISQQSLSIKTDILEPFIIYNQTLTNIPENFLDTVLFSIQQEIQGLNILDKRDINLRDIITRKRLIDDRITNSIRIEKNNSEKETRINRQMEQTTIEKNYTDFELENISFEAFIESPKISIMELFNNIVLNDDIPFATINNIYKVLSVASEQKQDFSPKQDWTGSLNNIITLKFKDNKDYTNCFVSIENQNDVELSIIKLILSVSVSKKREDIRNLTVQKILNIFLNSETLRVAQVNDIKLKGVFYFPKKGLNKFVLSDMIMNDKRFSKFLAIDESVQASKKTESLYIHFNNPKTGEITANITERYSFKGDPNLKGKDIVNLFQYKTYYLRVKITSVNNVNSILQFQQMISQLFKIYEDNFDTVSNFYKIYIPSFGQKEEPDIIIKPPKLKDLAPEVFVNGYPPTCPHQPTIIDDTEVEEAKREGKAVMRFPKNEDSTDNFPSRNYICNHEKAIYPGLRSNPLSNNDIVPFLPCCYEKDHNQIQGTEYRQYFFGDEPKSKFKFQQELIITNKFVGRDTFGTLPESLDRLFNVINNNKKYMYVRMGVTDSKSSFLECVLQGLYKQTGILKHKSDQARIKFINQYRTSLTNNKHLPICRQELYDFTIEQIQDKLNDYDQYFDPKLFVSILEKIYKCNIFVFNKNGLILPRFQKKYFSSKVNSKTNIFIYQHRGSKNERATYDRCELIVKWDTTGEDVEYIEDNQSSVSKKMSEIFDIVAKSYSFKGDGVSHSHQDFNYFSDSYIAQGIDSYGKTIMLQFSYEGREGTMLTSPMQPLPVQEIKNWVVNKINLQTALNFLVSIQAENILQNQINNRVENVSAMVGDISVNIPVISSRPNPSFRVNLTGNDTNLYNKTVSINKTFNRNKKLARYISEYVLWMFSSFLSERGEGVEIDLDQAINAFKQTIEIDESFQYPDYIGKTFSRDSGLLKNGSIVVKSREIAKRLIYHLKMQLRRNENKVLNYYKIPSIQDYYVDITDFDEHEGQIMISGPESLQHWINEKALKLNVFTNSIHLGVDTPYYFRNTLISDRIYMAQNTDSIEKAIKIALAWGEDGVNIGTNFEVEQVDIVPYTLYSYKNNSEIKRYRVGGGDSRIEIIGYKYNDCPLFTVLLN